MLNLKSLFKDKEAVSPVIGVVLMVAITVILAAAIGSSVLGEGTTDAAPQANLNVKVVNNTDDGGTYAAITLEHLGGDAITFDSNRTTKVMLTIDSTGNEVNITDLSTLCVGDTQVLLLKNCSTSPGPITVPRGTVSNFKIIDVATQQLIFEKDLRF